MNASRVEINIPARSNDVLYDAPWLLVRVKDIGGNDVTCVQFHLWFDRIEIVSQGRIVSSNYGDVLYFYKLAMHNDCDERIITDILGNVATAVIPSSESASYMIKLPFNENNEV